MVPVSPGSSKSAIAPPDSEPDAVAARPDIQPGESVTEPTRSKLIDHPVIGELGIPLGTVAEIRARVVAGSGGKGIQDIYLLRVTEVDGRSLAPAPVMEFRVPGFVRVNLASNNLDLYELKTGSEAGTLNSSQIDELRRDYVGKVTRLVVYEVGKFSGIPNNLPPDAPVWQDRGFGFSTSLVVLAERP
ncbi:MAG: hypothetical protein AMXMBFR47_13370 [Planctomycetota bacterium]